MPRINLTKEISEAIKDMRQSKDITASEIARDIQKSTGFISNIENCKSTTVDLRDIYTLIEHLTKDDVKTKEVMIQLLNNSTLLYSSDELKQRYALVSFDKQFRDIPIEDDFLDFVLSEIENIKLTPAQVIAEMNSNRFIDKNINDDFPPNKIIFSTNPDEMPFILFKLPEDYLDRILSREKKTSNYITLEGILYAINLQKGYPPTQSTEKAHETLKQLKIYTLPERRKIIETENIRGIVSDINAKFDINNTSLPKSLVNYFQSIKTLNEEFDMLKEKNIEYITSRLTTLHDNLSHSETISLTLAFLGLPLSDLKHLPQNKQREFFNEVKNLLQGYSEEKTDKTDKIVEFD